MSYPELAVLGSSSVINGKVYLPWLDGTDEFQDLILSTEFRDPDGELTLSPSQRDCGAVFRRPKDVLPPSFLNMVGPRSSKASFAIKQKVCGKASCTSVAIISTHGCFVWCSH